MRGIIFTELKKFVVSLYDEDTWRSILEDAYLGGKVYVATDTYADAEIEAILREICKRTGLTRDKALEKFGRYIAPVLIEKYRFLLDPSWKTEQLLLNVESTIHEVVRAREPEALPPRLDFESVRPGELRLIYESPRKMLSLGKGVVKAIGDYFGEDVVVAGKQQESGPSELYVFVLGPLKPIRNSA